MHDFEFDLSTDGALAGTAAVQASAPSEQLDVDPTHCDLESGREFTQTIGNQSNAINTADLRALNNRQLRLSRLEALRDRLMKAAEPAEAEEILEQSTVEAGTDQDGELTLVLAEIQNEVSECRLACAALAQARMPLCIEYCDNILRSKPHHVLFLGLRVKARAAEHSNQMAAVARIRALLDCGPLAEAQAALKKASVLFPELPELWELDLDIREKAIRVRNLVERGEEHLKDSNFQGAGGSFMEALHLLPFDSALGSRIAAVLRLYASTIEQVDPQAAESAIQLLQQIHPEAEPVAVAGPAVAPQPKGPLDPEILQITGTADQADFLDSAAAGSLQVIDVGRPPSGRSLRHLLAVLALAAALFVVLRISGDRSGPRNVMEIPEIIPGTLTIHSNVPDVAVLINNRTLNLPTGAVAAAVQLSPNTYEIRALRAGYAVFGPVTAAIKPGSNTTVDLQLKANPAALEITNAEPGTKVMLDGKLLGAVSKSGTLISEVAPGQHSVELSREGSLSRMLVRKFNSGEASTLTGPEIVLESTDARMILPKRVTPKLAVVKAEEPKAATVSPALKDLVSTLPPKLRAAFPMAEIPAPPKVQPPAPASPVLISDLDRRPPAPEMRRLENPESGAVLDVLHRFSEAWNAKDVKTITSIQHDLDKRALKAQLAPVKSIAMKISPVMPPQFDGAQATVVCRRQANETFSDGSARQNPETIVTYVLSKHDGVWAIDHIR